VEGDSQRWADAAARGDHQAFGALVRAEQQTVRRFCAHATSTGSADDLTQEVFVRAWSGLAGRRRDVPVRAWLLGIARHVVADDVRRRARRRRLASVESVDPATLAGVGSNDASGPDAVPATMLLNDLVTALPEDQRAAVVLTQVLGCSYGEAAEICGVPVGTIRSRVARARATMADALAPQGDVRARRGAS
jgi:RNA polymerase sigma-70 factor (ECF subfamily)